MNNYQLQHSIESKVPEATRCPFAVAIEWRFVWTENGKFCSYADPVEQSPRLGPLVTRLRRPNVWLKQIGLPPPARPRTLFWRQERIEKKRARLSFPHVPYLSMEQPLAACFKSSYLLPKAL
jgi:hypothetical protein